MTEERKTTTLRWINQAKYYMIYLVTDISKFSSLFIFLTQTLISFHGERQRLLLIVFRIQFYVVDDVSEKMCSFYPTSGCIIFEMRKVNVEIVVRRLVVKIDPQLTLGNRELLLDGSLLRGKVNKQQMLKYMIIL